MWELVGIGAAIAAVGAATKWLESKGGIPFNHPLCPDAYWERGGPGYYGGKWIFHATFRLPDDKTSVVSGGVDFIYYVCAGAERGVVARSEYGALLNDVQRKAMLLLAQRRAVERYETQTRAAIAKYKAETKLQAIESEWLNALNSDKERVIKAIRAGQSGRFSRDWQSEARAGGDKSVQERRAKAIAEAAGAIQSVEEVTRARMIKAAAEASEQQRRAALEAERERERAAESARREAEWARLEQERRDQEAAAQALALKLSKPIPLVGSRNGIVFGTNIETGSDVALPVNRLQHTLVVGVSGSGKSTFLHSLLWQLVRSTEAERLYLVDLKGGIEFDRYSDSEKVEVVWEFQEVVRLVERLMEVMRERQEMMRLNRWQTWPHGRTFLVIDEYAELQSEIDAANSKDEKAQAQRLQNNLKSISRRARALGVVLIAALQKGTTDAMDSSVRNNMGCRVCFRQGSRLSASAVLDGLEDAPEDPVELPTGRFIYYNASKGIRRYVQAHVAPGLQL